MWPACSSSFRHHLHHESEGQNETYHWKTHHGSRPQDVVHHQNDVLIKSEVESKWYAFIGTFWIQLQAKTVPVDATVGTSRCGTSSPSPALNSLRVKLSCDFKHLHPNPACICNFRDITMSHIVTTKSCIEFIESQVVILSSDLNE